MKSEAEVRAAVDDLIHALRAGLVPPECRHSVGSQVVALRYVLGDTSAGVETLAHAIDMVRGLRVDDGMGG